MTRIMSREQAIRLAHSIVDSAAAKLDAGDYHPADLARVFIYAAAMAEGCTVGAATQRGDGLHVAESARIETLQLVEEAKAYAPTLLREMLQGGGKPG